MIPDHVLQAVDEELLKSSRSLNAVVEAVDAYLYHETRREHLASIREEGLRPTSYGQSFVRDDGSVESPDEALDEIKRELEGDDYFEDEEDLENKADYDERAREILGDTHPAEDFVPRTYVSLSEPRALNYGEVLLRFPRSLARPTDEGDVDHYIKKAIPASSIEMLVDGAWRRLT